MNIGLRLSQIISQFKQFIAIEFVRFKLERMKIPAGVVIDFELNLFLMLLVIGDLECGIILRIIDVFKSNELIDSRLIKVDIH